MTTGSGPVSARLLSYDVIVVGMRVCCTGRYYSSVFRAQPSGIPDEGVIYNVSRKETR